MLENQYNIKIFKIPPYASTVNGQIERFHSTLTEIMRCLKTENVHSTFSELLDRSLYEYNNTIHSTILRKPVEAFFGRRNFSDPQELLKDRVEIIERLKGKQAQDLEFHNKQKLPAKEYKIGERIFVKVNKRLGTKLSKSYQEEIVKENRRTTVLTETGRTVHKNNIRN